MAVNAGTPPLAAFPSIPLHRRLYGFGSIYGKTIRDSRLSFTIAAGLLGGMSLVMRELLKRDLIHGEEKTVDGRTLAKIAE